MKRISAFLLMLAAVLGMTTTVFADAIGASPGEVFVSAVGAVLSIVLIAAVLVITALLVHHFTKKK